MNEKKNDCNHHAWRWARAVAGSRVAAGAEQFPFPFRILILLELFYGGFNRYTILKQAHLEITAATTSTTREAVSRSYA